MATVEISQINNSIKTALGETAGTFRKASNDNNVLMGKVVKDISRVFSQQKNQIASLNDNIEEVAHHSQQTSSKVDKLSNILSESVALQSQMVTHMRNMVDGIQNTNKSIFGVQNIMGGAGTDTVLGKLMYLVNLFSYGMPIVTNLVAIAGGIKLLTEKFGVSTGDLNPFGGGGGATPGAGGGAGVKQVSNPVMAKDVYNYLTKEKGVDHNHAVGIMANIQNESRFNSGAIGDNGTSGGLFQHHNERFSAMRQAAGADWQHNWKGQIDYAMTEGDMQKYLKRPVSSGQEAASAFVYDFERPLDKSGQAAARSRNVPAVENLISGGGATPKSGKEGKGGGSESPLTVTAATDGSSTKTGKDAERVAHNHDNGIISGAEQQVKKETAGSLPSGNLVGLGKALQAQGLSVSEHPAFGGVKPGAHGKNSAHYKGDAIDVNIPGAGPEASNAQASARFDKLADALTAAGYNVLWKVHGHYDHIHAQVGTQGVKGGFWKGGGGKGTAAGSTGAATPGATTPSSGMPDSTTPGSSPGSTETPAANPLETSPYFSSLTGGTSYGELAGAIRDIIGGGNPGGGAMGNIMGEGASLSGMSSAMGGIPGLGSAGSIMSMLGPMMGGIGGGSDTPTPEPVTSGQMLQSMSQSNQVSELNRQAIVREAQNQISTEIATQTATDKAVEDNNLRNSNRNEGRPIMSDYNRPEDKGWPEWLNGFGTGVYDDFIRQSGGIRRA